ncbi:MAG TPA: PASTA domain-containing protein [Bacteroidia bacterium]|nr:PASTA domain-containing protein [Bacteroidia bacterium]
MASSKSSGILKHILIIVGLYAIIIWTVLQWLKSFTQHDIVVKVPELKGKSPKDLKELEKTIDLEFIINDSVYVVDEKKGTVIDQNPSAGSEVKQNRKVYITINAFKPPAIKMPKLIDFSLRQAKAVLETYGLEIGNIKYEPDFAKDAVLKQFYRGREIKPGDPIVLESKIDLVLGDGLKGEKVELPDLIGLNRKEAINKITENSLSIGSEVYDKTVEDSSKAIVYRQFPIYSSNDKVNLGRAIDLFYTQDMSKIKSAKDSLKSRLNNIEEEDED